MKNLLDKIDYKKLVGKNYEGRYKYTIVDARKVSIDNSDSIIVVMVAKEYWTQKYGSKKTKESISDILTETFDYSFLDTEASTPHIPAIVIEVKNPLMRSVENLDYFTLCGNGSDCYYEFARNCNSLSSNSNPSEAYNPFFTEYPSRPISKINELRFPQGEKFLRKEFSKLLSDEDYEEFKNQFKAYCLKHMNFNLREETCLIARRVRELNLSLKDESQKLGKKYDVILNLEENNINFEF